MDELGNPVNTGTREVAIYAGIILVVVIAGAWFYAAPYLTLNQIREAAQNGDVETLSDLIDFPALRESIKETLKATMLREMAKEKEQNFFTALGTMVAGALIDPVVEGFVSPSGIASMTQGRRPSVEKNENKSESPGSQRESDSTIASKDQAWSSARMEYNGFSKFLVRFPDETTGRDSMILVLRRSGFSWKLSALRMPLLLSDASSDSQAPKPAALPPIEPKPFPALSPMKLEYVFSKSRSNILFLNFTVSNENGRALSAYTITCKQYGASGTLLGSSSKTIYGNVQAKAKQDFDSFEMGLVDSQTERVACEVTDLVAG
jgi:hypothetical protein